MWEIMCAMFFIGMFVVGKVVWDVFTWILKLIKKGFHKIVTGFKKL